MKTRYDVLEVSGLAGKEAIDAFCKRLAQACRQPLLLILSVVAVSGLALDAQAGPEPGADRVGRATTTVDGGDSDPSEAESGGPERIEVIAKSGQERYLEAQIELLKQEIEVLKMEQQRKDRESEARISAEDRLLQIEEGRFGLAKGEAMDRRGQNNYRFQQEQLQDNIGNLTQALEMQKDLNATRRGISRGLYDRMENSKGTERPPLP